MGTVIETQLAITIKRNPEGYSRFASKRVSNSQRVARAGDSYQSALVGGLRVCGFRSFASVWFPYRRWPLVVIVNLPGPIAFRAAVLVITHPPPAITMRTNLHCRLSASEAPTNRWRPGNCLGATGVRP